MKTRDVSRDVDMSPEAIATRLEELRALYLLSLSLQKARRASQRTERKRSGEDPRRPG